MPPTKKRRTEEQADTETNEQLAQGELSLETPNLDQNLVHDGFQAETPEQQVSEVVLDDFTENLNYDNQDNQNTEASEKRVVVRPRPKKRLLIFRIIGKHAKIEIRAKEKTVIEILETIEGTEITDKIIETNTQKTAKIINKYKIKLNKILPITKTNHD